MGKRKALSRLRAALVALGPQGVNALIEQIDILLDKAPVAVMTNGSGDGSVKKYDPLVEGRSMAALIRTGLMSGTRPAAISARAEKRFKREVPLRVIEHYRRDLVARGYTLPPS